jgi:hypothetical protein
MVITFTQTGDTGGAISQIATFGVPAFPPPHSVVPEPNRMAMVVLVLGTGGAISLARRRFSRAQARVRPARSG